jgi:hypothetical protein
MKLVNSKPTQTRSTPVRAVRYTQAQGFSDIEDLGAELGIELPDDLDDYFGTTLEAAGWAHDRTETYGDPDFAGASARIYAHKTSARFVIDLDLYDTYEFVLVDGRSNLMALRIALAPFLQLGLFEKLMTTGPDFAVRAFLHEYNHEPSYSCKVCETGEERTERKEREKRTARKRES